MNSRGKSIFQLIEEGEHQCQDFKFCINDSKKIAKSLVAFANTDGGRLLIGVKDNGKIAGVQSDEEYYMIEAAANIYSKPKISFDTKLWTVDSKTVLEVIIEESGKKPHLAKDESNKWIPYMRVDDENVVMNKVLLKAMEFEKKRKGMIVEYGTAHEALFDYLNRHGKITLSKFTKIANLKFEEAENILAGLLFMGNIKGDFLEYPPSYCLNE